MNEGNRILEEISKVVGSLEEQRNEAVNGVSLEFNNELEKRIQDFVTVREPGKKPVQMPISSPSSRESAPAKFKEIYEPMIVPPKRSITQHHPTPVSHIQERTSIQEIQSPMLHNPDDFLLEAHEDPVNEEPIIVREVRDQPLNIPSISIREPEVPKPPSTFVVSPTNFSSPGETSRKMAEKNSMMK